MGYDLYTSWKPSFQVIRTKFWASKWSIDSWNICSKSLHFWDFEHFTFKVLGIATLPSVLGIKHSSFNNTTPFLADHMSAVGRSYGTMRDPFSELLRPVSWKLRWHDADAKWQEKSGKSWKTSFQLYTFRCKCVGDLVVRILFVFRRCCSWNWQQIVLITWVSPHVNQFDPTWSYQINFQIVRNAHEKTSCQTPTLPDLSPCLPCLVDADLCEETMQPIYLLPVWNSVQPGDSSQYWPSMMLPYHTVPVLLRSHVSGSSTGWDWKLKNITWKSIQYTVDVLFGESYCQSMSSSLLICLPKCSWENATKIIKRQKKQNAYCWWKKSCTSCYVAYPIIYRVLNIPGGCLGFLPSTVGKDGNLRNRSPMHLFL